MFCSFVQALLDYRQKESATKAHALDMIRKNMEYDLNEAVLLCRPLIRDNIQVFETSRTFLHFLSRMANLDFTQTSIIREENVYNVERENLEDAPLKQEITSLRQKEQTCRRQLEDERHQANAKYKTLQQDRQRETQRLEDRIQTLLKDQQGEIQRLEDRIQTLLKDQQEEIQRLEGRIQTLLKDQQRLQHENKQVLQNNHTLHEELTACQNTMKQMTGELQQTLHNSQQQQDLQLQTQHLQTIQTLEAEKQRLQAQYNAALDEMQQKFQMMKEHFQQLVKQKFDQEMLTHMNQAQDYVRQLELQLQNALSFTRQEAAIPENVERFQRPLITEVESDDTNPWVQVNPQPLMLPATNHEQLKASYELEIEQLKADYELEIETLKKNYEQGKSDLIARYEHGKEQLKYNLNTEHEQEKKLLEDKLTAQLEHSKAEQESQQQHDIQQLKTGYELEIEQLKAGYELKIEQLKAGSELEKEQLKAGYELEKSTLKKTYEQSKSDLMARYEHREEQRKYNLNAEYEQEKEQLEDKLIACQNELEQSKVEQESVRQRDLQQLKADYETKTKQLLQHKDEEITSLQKQLSKAVLSPRPSPKKDPPSPKKKLYGKVHNAELKLQQCKEELLKQEEEYENDIQELKKRMQVSHSDLRNSLEENYKLTNELDDCIKNNLDYTDQIQRLRNNVAEQMEKLNEYSSKRIEQVHAMDEAAQRLVVEVQRENEENMNFVKELYVVIQPETDLSEISMKTMIENIETYIKQLKTMYEKAFDQVTDYCQKMNISIDIDSTAENILYTYIENLLHHITDLYVTYNAVFQELSDITNVDIELERISLDHTKNILNQAVAAIRQKWHTFENMPVNDNAFYAINRLLVIKYFELIYDHVIQSPEGTKIERVSLQKLYAKLSSVQTDVEYRNFIIGQLALISTVRKNESRHYLVKKITSQVGNVDKNIVTFFESLKSEIIDYLTEYAINIHSKKRKKTDIVTE